MERKQFIRTLSFLAFSGPMALISCKKDDIDLTSEIGTDTTIDSTCTVTPSETEGPFPTKSPASYVRSDIRKGDGLGVEMAALITIASVKNSCSPLAGALVDIWHCDVDGNYSQYGGTQMQPTNYQSVPTFQIYMGAFVGKEEYILDTDTAFNYTFAMALDGNFEVEQRLLFQGDALSLPNFRKIGAECLSATGLLLVLHF